MGAANKSVFITGASSGLGYDCATTFDREGYRVFAGVRKDADAERLAGLSSDRLSPVICDVGDYDSVERARQQIEDQLQGAGLDGLVNNAGMSVSGPLELVPMELFEQQMHVNVNGQLAVTQAMLPMLRQKRGRVVFMGSESGLVTLPMLGAYSASKHALEALANAFRLELRPFGMRVALIEPGSIKSEIWRKAQDAGTDHLRDDPAARSLYADLLQLMAVAPKLAEKGAIGPEAVTRAVRHALEAHRPKARYLVGAEARALTMLNALTPTSIHDSLVDFSVRQLGKRLAR